ncbi:Uncharacterised protein [uncultured archaeon]|nr:Uncharacterised protein [uncultured archaeon]
MKRLVYIRVADREVHLPKLIGSFVLAAAVLMFLHACFAMADSWNTINYYTKCVEGLSALPTIDQQLAQFSFCSEALYRATGIVARGNSAMLTGAQLFGGLLTPIANVLFWVAVLLFGYLLYRSGDLELPLEETVREVADYPATPRHTFRKKK